MKIRTFMGKKSIKVRAAGLMTAAALLTSACGAEDLEMFTRTSESEGLYKITGPFRPLVVDKNGREDDRYFVNSDGQIVVNDKNEDLYILSLNTEEYVYTRKISITGIPEYVVLNTSETVKDNAKAVVAEEKEFDIVITAEPADATLRSYTVSLVSDNGATSVSVPEEYRPEYTEDGSVKVTAAEGKVTAKIRCTGIDSAVLTVTADDALHRQQSAGIVTILHNCFELEEEESESETENEEPSEDMSAEPKEQKQDEERVYDRPVITKSPTGETVGEGGNAVFIAYSDMADSAEWYVTDSENNSMKLSEWKKAMPGMVVTGEREETVVLSNIPAAMDGTLLKCVFKNSSGESETEEAVLRVNASEKGAEFISDVENESHTHAYTGEVTRAANCFSEGERTYTCWCGERYQEQIPKTGHVYSGGICIYCGKEYENIYARNVIIDLPQPEDQKTEPDDAERQTWEEAGSTEEPVILPMASPEPVTETEEDITYEQPVHEHRWEKDILTSVPTCTSNGKEMYRCECGEIKTAVIPATGHRYANGKCEMCGKADPNHIHTWDAGVTVKESTCCEEGSVEYTCGICGKTMSETVPKTEHSYNCEGVCVTCGNADNIFYGYGTYLKKECLCDYDKMMCIADFVNRYGFGECTGKAGCAHVTADAAGLRNEIRTVGMVKCKASGKLHEASDFERNMYCAGCGMGNNHHWNRFYIGDDWYEFDFSVKDRTCVYGPNVTRYGILP